MSRVFKPLRKARAAFWIGAVALLLLFHVPYIGGDAPVSLNGVFEAACVIVVFPAIVWLAASGTTTDKTSTSVCRFLGDISYPLYIVHYPLMYALLHVAHQDQAVFLCRYMAHGACHDGLQRLHSVALPEVLRRAGKEVAETPLELLRYLRHVLARLLRARAIGGHMAHGHYGHGLMALPPETGA